MSGAGAVVLVHGGFVDGSGWREVYRLLNKHDLGVSIVQTPTLSLEGDVAAAKRIRANPSSSSGTPTAERSSPRRATIRMLRRSSTSRRFAPDTGESVNTLIADPPPGAPVPPILPPRDGFLFLDRDKFHASFAADIPAEEAAFVADSQVPCGVDALGGTISEPAWRSKPSWYLVATDDRMIPPPAQRSMAERAGSTVVEVAGSHSIYLSQPAAVAGLIEQARSALMSVTFRTRPEAAADHRRERREPLSHEGDSAECRFRRGRRRARDSPACERQREPPKRKRSNATAGRAGRSTGF
jgi:hypothetical protein